MDQREEQAIERILVALDPSAHSRAALAAAARMAMRFRAELMAMFVEDANVRRLSQLSFVQEVGLYTRQCRSVEVGELDRQLRVQAGRMQQAFSVVTRRVETRCTFRQVRGRVVQQVLEAAAEADVVIVGKGAWSAVDTGRLAPDVREILTKAPSSTLVLGAEKSVEPPMRAVYDGTVLGEKALATASRLAEDGHLTVFVLADDDAEAERLAESAQDWVEGRELELSFQTLSQASVSRLAYLVSHEGEGTLVLPAHEGTMEDEALLDFLDETDAPVLLVR